MGCVDKWEPVVGRLKQVGQKDYRIQWDYDKIETIRQAILGKKVYACWGGIGYNRPEETSFGTDRGVEYSITHYPDSGQRWPGGMH